MPMYDIDYTVMFNETGFVTLEANNEVDAEEALKDFLDEEYTDYEDYIIDKVEESAKE